MDPQQAKSIFLHAVEHVPPGDWPDYLAGACGDDAGLRHGVELLLSAHRENVDLADQARQACSDVLPTFDQPVLEKPGTQIGPYKLVEHIGEGGMGTVWMAQQSEPVKRLVALKLIKAGMDSRQVIARFEAERQALALMDHPNIARVLDGGTTSAGRPYFVMDLVRGVPITRYCDEHHLTPRQRLELFIPVCQAIQHAHQKGIIHRDLKPSNVLVVLYDGKPVPKVIDFGVAKAIGSPLTEKTMFTGFGQLVGTLEYMSPEQANVNQLDIDTRSDIYSLGVLMYELLTGSTPFDKHRLRSAAWDEMLRIIREEEPEKPSTRLIRSGLPSRTSRSRLPDGTSAAGSNADSGPAEPSEPTLASIAAVRGTEPAKLTKLVRGELDWIVMKALEKDRSRRYETASALVTDLQRYLNDEPVVACPPSAVYRFQKFARRNKAALITASAMAFAVLLAVAGLAASYAQITQTLWREKQILEREQQTSYLQRVASAARELDGNDLGRAEELLDECDPGRRGWEWHYLKRRRYQSPRDLPHSEAVFCVAYSPNGRYLASGCRNGTVAIWDRQTGKARPWKDRHSSHVCSVAFSGDSRYLATGGADAKILIWDVSNGLVHTLRGHAGTINQVAFSPNARRLASASEDGTVRLWDLQTGQVRLVFREHEDAVRGLAFDGEGQRLISASAEGSVKVWVEDTGIVVAAFAGPVPWVSAMAFHAASHRLALAGYDGTLVLWEEPPAGKFHMLRGHTAHVTSLAFSPSGWRLASADDEKVLKIWDTAAGLEAIALASASQTTGVGVAFSPDGFELAVGCATRQVKLYDGTPLSDQEKIDGALTLTGHQDPVLRVAFSPDNRRLASSSRDGTVKLWEVSTGRELLAFRQHTAIVSAVAFSPDGRHVASGSWDGNVLIWNVADGHVIHTLRGQASFVYDVDYSLDGIRLASAHASGDVIVWDPVAGQEVNRIHAHTYEAACAAFSPDGKLLATGGGRDNSAKVWFVASGKEALTLEMDAFASAARVRCTKFSADGQWLVTIGHGTFNPTSSVMIWDTSTGKPIRSIDGQTKRLFQVALSPDGRWLASGGLDETVKMWDLTKAEKPVFLRGHAGHVLGVAFSSDGRRLASCGGYRGKGEIKIWNAAQWENKAPSAERLSLDRSR